MDRAYNGLEAVNRVKEGFLKNTHTYGLIITDISMPILDGFQMCQQVRNFYRKNKAPQPKIVACTAHVQEELFKEAW